MGLSYLKVFKQALILAKTKKFLWGLALFLIWGNLALYLIIFSRGQNQNQVPVKQMNLTDYFSQSQQIGLALGVIALIAIAIWLYLLARAGMTLAVKNILDHKPHSFKGSLQGTNKFVGRLFKIWFTNGLIFLFALLALAAPVGYLISLGSSVRATILAILAVIIFLPVLLTTVMMNVFSGFYAVLMNLSVSKSFRASYDLISRYWWPLVLFSVIVFVFAILLIVAGFLMQAIVLLPFVILSGLPYDMGGNLLASPYILSGLVVSFGLFLWYLSVVSAFQHISWILVFLELVKPVKFQEEDGAEEVVPELVS
jgi:hypothetical protein